MLKKPPAVTGGSICSGLRPSMRPQVFNSRLERRLFAERQRGGGRKDREVDAVVAEVDAAVVAEQVGAARMVRASSDSAACALSLFKAVKDAFASAILFWFNCLTASSNDCDLAERKLKRTRVRNVVFIFKY